MLISFFEEFPTNENLAKLKLITWPTKLYLAAKSLEEFNSLKSKIQKKIKNKKIKEFIYWPILAKKEGYWISPYSKRKALQRIFSELNSQKISVMLDLELPTSQNPWLYVTQKHNFFRNKKLIRNFIADYSGTVYLSEYYPESKWGQWIMRFFGLHYQQNKNQNNKVKVIKMLYHSMHNFSQEFLLKELRRGRKEFGDNYLVAYGCISKGIMGNEPILQPEVLKQDLETARKEGVKEVVLFRAAGLEKKYSKILQGYC